MKNYSRNAAGKGKTTFRTGDRWRARKYMATLRVKLQNPKHKSQTIFKFK